MKLFRVVGKRLVHKYVNLPPIIDEHICITGREGPVCKTDFGFFYLVDRFEGEDKDITCKKCRSLA